MSSFRSIVTSLVLFAVAWVRFLSTPEAQLVYPTQNGQQLRSRAALLAGDPKLGEAIALPHQDVFGRSKRNGQEMILVAVGSCRSCTFNSFDPNLLLAATNKPVAFLFENETATLKESEASLKDKVLVFSDPQSKIVQKLNVMWIPRLYLLDSEGRIKAIQKSEDERPSFL
jgi:hypothetical protein